MSTESNLTNKKSALCIYHFDSVLLSTRFSFFFVCVITA